MSNESEAFEAGREGKFKTFRAWKKWFYTCTSCGKDTSGTTVHRCEESATGPYRTAALKEPPDFDRAAERLLIALYLYPHYRVDSRGPLGCIMDALEIICPEAHKALNAHEGDASHALCELWPEEYDEGHEEDG